MVDGSWQTTDHWFAFVPAVAGLPPSLKLRRDKPTGQAIGSGLSSQSSATDSGWSSISRVIRTLAALASFRIPNDTVFVTREQIESAVASGRPFALRMADGREYQVQHRDYISLPPPRASYVIVYDDTGHFTVLPLLTMTGLQSSVT